MYMYHHYCREITSLNYCVNISLKLGRDTFTSHPTSLTNHTDEPYYEKQTRNYFLTFDFIGCLTSTSSGLFSNNYK